MASEVHTATIVRDDDGVWVRSEFPHPLVTLDYDKDDRLIQVVVCGRDLKVVTNDD